MLSSECWIYGRKSSRTLVSTMRASLRGPGAGAESIAHRTSSGAPWPLQEANSNTVPSEGKLAISQNQRAWTSTTTTQHLLGKDYRLLAQRIASSIQQQRGHQELSRSEQGLGANDPLRVAQGSDHQNGVRTGSSIRRAVSCPNRRV